MTTAIDAVTLVTWLGDGDEIALIDIREEGLFGEGHLLFAANLPYSRLERDIAPLVPRQGTRTVLVGEDGIVELAARRLAGLGYDRVHVLAGGVAAWAAAGHEVFEGVYVPSKAFAEVIEHACHTPAITASDLDGLFRSQADVVVLDSRTPEEFARFHVPGAISCPSAELVYRFADLVPSPDTFVVVSCAGRTRGIIGAQALINAGVPNKVAALEGGTQGWRLAGLSTEPGNPGVPGPVSEAARRAAEARAADLAARFEVPSIDLATFAAWRGDAGRTTYLFDVRPADEFAAGHLPSAVWIPGGQLVQSLDVWAATRRGRIVLADDQGVRAVVTAHWLRQIGWDATVLRYDPATATLEIGAPLPTSVPPVVPEISPAEAKARLAGGAAVVAIEDSGDYRNAHVDGAVWANRSRLADLPYAVRQAGDILLFGRDSSLAHLAATDLRESNPAATLAVVRGGPEEWRAAGLALTDSPTVPPDEKRVDFLFWLHDRHLGNAESSRRYLAWEGQLPRQIGSPEAAGYRLRLAG
jgi:rhodanese-related sulfurtransferase